MASWRHEYNDMHCTPYHTHSSKRATATGMSGENRLHRVVTLPLDWELKQPSAYKIILSRILPSTDASKDACQPPGEREGVKGRRRSSSHSYTVLRRTSMPLFDLPDLRLTLRFHLPRSVH